MINFKKILVVMWLILGFLGQFSLLKAGELFIPVPADTIKISEQDFGSGETKAKIQTYQTKLNQGRVEAFYQKAMLEAGWRQNPKKKEMFTKGDYFVLISFQPSKKWGQLNEIWVAINKAVDQNEILKQRKTNPDKLKFMPTYPRAIQNFLLNNPRGVSVSYETNDSIQEALFFYKTGMLNYGWYLYSEIPLKEEVIQQRDVNNSNKPFTVSNASLRYRKNTGESCFIRIISALAPESLLPGEVLVNNKASEVARKTSILIVYNEQKKIN